MRFRSALIGALAVMLSACYPPTPTPALGANPMVTDPAGTVDTTHGAEGAQTSPH